jgi:hypothetical protein
VGEAGRQEGAETKADGGRGAGLAEALQGVKLHLALRTSAKPVPSDSVRLLDPVGSQLGCQGEHLAWF